MRKNCDASFVLSISQAGVDELFASGAAKAAFEQEAVGPRSEPDSAKSAGPARPQEPLELSRILKLSVPVIVVLAQRDMTVESILKMTIGTIIEFDVSADAELQLKVANHTIGGGQAVKAGENFALRIAHIDSVSQRVDALGGS